MYNTQTGQLTFWSGSPQGGATLQSINLPTLTYQQYIQLANGQIPPGIKPGWYYYPTLNEFVYVNTQTIQQPNWNNLWFGYSYQPITNNQINTNTSTTNQQPQILENSFFSSQLLSDIRSGITTLGKGVYNWFTGLFSSKGSISSSNITNYNYPSINLSNVYKNIQNWETNNYNQYAQTLTKSSSNISTNITNTNFESGSNQYITGVLAPPVQLSGKQAYQAELQNIIWES